MSEAADLVLIVDDDKAVGEALRFALELEGLRVRVYRSGQEILAATDIPGGGCLVIDYLMPGMDGCELMARLRERQINCPAILITSDANVNVQRGALHCGYRCVLEKPLNDDTLLKTIRTSLRQHRMIEGRSVDITTREPSPGDGRTAQEQVPDRHALASASGELFGPR
jgi:FixJ family two-component response regulator